MAKSTLDSILAQVCPEPRIETIAGEEFEFWPLTLEEFAQIKKNCGVDLTQQMFSGGGKMDFVDSELILEAIWASMRISKKPIVKDLTREKAAKLVAHGLGGFTSPIIAELFSFALTGKGKDAKDAKDEADSGEAKSLESTGG